MKKITKEQVLASKRQRENVTSQISVRNHEE